MNTPHRDCRTNLPLVTIGLPVYNGAAYLTTAIESLLNQDYPNLEVLIRDNASTDDKASICLQAAARNPRIRYVRNEQNIGPLANYCRLVNDAQGHYFMWAADDDLRNRCFVRKLVACLQNQPRAVLATPQTVAIDSHAKPLPLPAQPPARTGSQLENVRRFFNPQNPGWACDGWFYGLFRRDWLKRHTAEQLAFPPWGGDLLWLFSILIGEDASGSDQAKLYKRVQPSGFQPQTWFQRSMFRLEMLVGFTQLCARCKVSWRDKARLQYMAWTWYCRSFFYRDRKLRTWLRGARLMLLDSLLSSCFLWRRLFTARPQGPIA